MLVSFLIFYAGLCTAALIAVIIWARHAPYGREIPGVGFVEDDPHQLADGDWPTPFPLAGGFTGEASRPTSFITARNYGRHLGEIEAAAGKFGHLSNSFGSRHGEKGSNS